MIGPRVNCPGAIDDENWALVSQAWLRVANRGLCQGHRHDSAPTLRCTRSNGHFG